MKFQIAIIPSCPICSRECGGKRTARKKILEKKKKRKKITKYLYNLCGKGLVGRCSVRAEAFGRAHTNYKGRGKRQRSKVRGEGS